MNNIMNATVLINTNGGVDSSVNPNPMDVPIQTDFSTSTDSYGPPPPLTFISYEQIFNGIATTGKVLLPANIGADEKLPVLYLLNGQGGNNEWETYGDIQHLLGYMFNNNLVKQKFVVVMPDVFGKSTGSDDQKKMHDYQNLENVLKGPNGLMNYIVENYQGLPGKQNSSIAGLSMGGVAALYLGFNLQDDFYSIGSFAPVSVLFDKDLGWLDPDTQFIFGTGTDHFIFVGVGTSDNVEYPHFYMKKLNDFKNNNTYCTLPGGHSWGSSGDPGPFRTLLYVFLTNKIFDC